jgi:NAD(P)-dependent dehydrogenase (short-subunit alcohol dehydrogenase family)
MGFYRCFVTNADIQPGKFESDGYQYVQCDVRSWADQLSVFKQAMSNSPQKNIDIVVANAGIAVTDPIFVQCKSSKYHLHRFRLLLTTAIADTDDPPEPDFKIININFIGVAYTTKLAIHYFSKSPTSDKCLVLKSSLAGYMDLIGVPCYNSTKFAVRGLMCSLRRTQLCRVNLVAPWLVLCPDSSITKRIIW